jgi:hypothetical protein
MVIYSDNDTNFVAAEKELREAFEEFRQHSEELKSTLACENIEWHFSPPHGPHFGGVWERLVQSCKRAMKVTIQNRLVTDSVLNTAIAEVASLLNSRPLTHLSVDTEDPGPLTPNNFLHGGPRPYVVLTLTNLTRYKRSWTFEFPLTFTSVQWCNHKFLNFQKFHYHSSFSPFPLKIRFR